MRRRRSGLAILAGGLFVAAALLAPLAPDSPFGPPPARASDDQCKTSPTLCATVTIAFTPLSDGYGHVYSQSNGATDGFLDCIRYGDFAQGGCTTKYYIADAAAGRAITLIGQATPSGATEVCDSASCSTNFVSIGITLYRNQTYNRTYSMLLQNAVNVEVTKVGSGYVSSDPLGIGCGADCAQHFPGSYPVTLTAVPAEGYIWVGFSGHVDCFTKHTSCTFSPTVNTLITATFMVPTQPPPATATPGPIATATATPRPTRTPGPTKTPSPTKTPTPGSTPLAGSTAIATNPATGAPTAGPLPTTTAEATAALSLAPTALPSLPPIATRPPGTDEAAASGLGDLTPWLVVILVTVVAMGGFVLGRARR